VPAPAASSVPALPAMPPVSRRLAVLLGAFALLAGASAEAGHELPFYPSFYPQEIRVEALEPGPAAAQTSTQTLMPWIKDNLGPLLASPTEPTDGTVLIAVQP